MTLARPASISELDDAAKEDRDCVLPLSSPSRSLKYYLACAQEYEAKAEALEAGAGLGPTAKNPDGSSDRGRDLECAFIAFARCASLVLEVIPAHPDYRIRLTDDQRINLSLNGQDILDELGCIRPELVERYQRYATSSATSNAVAIPAFRLHLPSFRKLSTNDESSILQDATTDMLEGLTSSEGSSKSPPARRTKKLLIYKRIFNLISSASRSWTAMHAHLETASASNSISAVVKSRDSRTVLLQLAESFHVPQDAKFRSALSEDEHRLAQRIVSILSNDSKREDVAKLEGDAAQAFLDVVQDCLEKGLLRDAEHNSKARRMIVRLSETCDKLPSSLFISGVTGRDEHAQFGGGFGDIYQADYAGKTVALKRIRSFLRNADQHRIRRAFCREALVWQHLQHRSILPLIGIDRETFPGSLCLVSPWMENGTIIKHIDTHRRTNLDKLLLDVAEGLEYLHLKNIVHGDLRGANILITPDWSACLADFGLATFSDATAATRTTTHRAGSIRWMAPELIDPERFGRQFVRTPATDIYAFACVCLELYTSRPPFNGLSETATLLKVIEGARPERPTGGAAMAEGLWKLVTECWAQDVVARPLTSALVTHLRGGNTHSERHEVQK